MVKAKAYNIVKVTVDEIAEMSFEEFEDLIAKRAGYPGKKEAIEYDQIGNTTNPDTIFFNVHTKKSGLGIISSISNFFGTKRPEINEVEYDQQDLSIL
ncbi:MAG TPA: hypothetical protein DSN98_08710 [Thermoplasmata archaeon]|jgi:hypothetical protein|nr:MAG TPA: hypothetical protein DSN98_08710 [Thermoplasmata archaeon]